MKSLQIRLFFLLSMCVLGFPFEAKANRIQRLYTVTYQDSATYKFEIGDKLEMSFVKNCNLYFGKIENFDDQKINLRIEEQLWGDKLSKNLTELIYIPLSPKSKFHSEARSPWASVDIKSGKKLFVSQCLNSSNQPQNLVIVSKEDFFPVIREIIKHRVSLQQNPQILPESTKLLGERSNLIYTSYIVSYLWREKVENKNVTNFLEELLRDKNVPLFLQDFVRTNLKKSITPKT